MGADIMHSNMQGSKREKLNITRLNSWPLPTSELQHSNYKEQCTTGQICFITILHSIIFLQNRREPYLLLAKLVYVGCAVQTS